NFFHDTLAGLLVGALILAAAFYARRFFSARNVSAGTKAVLVMLFAPVSQVLLFAISIVIGPVAIPGLWRRLAMQGTDLPPFLVFSPYDSSLMVGLAAGVFGAGLFLFLRERGLVPAERSVVSREAMLLR